VLERFAAAGYGAPEYFVATPSAGAREIG
jgi:hypothetical protein